MLLKASWCSLTASIRNAIIQRWTHWNGKVNGFLWSKRKYTFDGPGILLSFHKGWLKWQELQFLNLQRSLSSFMDFLWGIFFKNTWNLRVERIAKSSGTLNKKICHLFDKSLATLEFLHQTILSHEETRFCLIFGSNHKKVFRKLTARWSWMSSFWRSKRLRKMDIDASVHIF